MRRNQDSNATLGSIVTRGAFIALLFLFCVWNTRPVFGEEARPCAEDIANFCKDVRPGGGRIIACLKKHESALTSVCKDKLQEVQNRLEDAKRTCANDIEKFCKGVEEGEGRIARCLGEHTTDLSSACRERLEWVKTKARGE